MVERCRRARHASYCRVFLSALLSGSSVLSDFSVLSDLSVGCLSVFLSDPRTPKSRDSTLSKTSESMAFFFRSADGDTWSLGGRFGVAGGAVGRS
jgi:hypothetical protein